jgi:hypothetical protein
MLRILRRAYAGIGAAVPTGPSTRVQGAAGEAGAFDGEGGGTPRVREAGLG